MSSQKLVRCMLHPRDPKVPATHRFVPLEIFGLWEYLMSRKHQFQVSEARASLWLDMEDSPEAAYSDHPYERVTEVTAFVYSGRDEMFTRACRYFRSEECERLKELFLSHYRNEGARLQAQVRERPGIWLLRDPATAGS
jgi:hypothetical protein